MRLHHGLVCYAANRTVRQSPAEAHGSRRPYHAGRSAPAKLLSAKTISVRPSFGLLVLYVYSVRQSTAFAKRFYTNSPLCLTCSELVRKVLCKFPTQCYNSTTFSSAGPSRFSALFFELTAVKNFHSPSRWVRAAVLARAARISSAGVQQTCRPIRPAET